MIHPSYNELINVVNNGVEEGDDPVVTSRYSIVLATSRRARQIIGSQNPEELTHGKKPLSVAVDELYKGKIHILSQEESEKLIAEKEAKKAEEEAKKAKELAEKKAKMQEEEAVENTVTDMDLDELNIFEEDDNLE